MIFPMNQKSKRILPMHFISIISILYFIEEINTDKISSYQIQHATSNFH